MVIIFIGRFRMIIDLHLVAIIYRHPFFEGLDRYPDKHPGVAVEFLHFKNNPDGTIFKFSFRRIQEPHPTGAPYQAAQVLSIK